MDPARRTVAVDVVDHLTGDAAVRACREDGGHGTGESCRNGYVRDTPTRVRSMPVAGDATITMSPAVTARRATLTQVAAGLPSRNLYQLRVTDGRVTSLDEVYRP